MTDANGDLFLSLEAGSYVLEEEFPTGYSGAARIAFTVDENCRITAISSDGPSGSVSNTESSIMVRNQSHLLTSVTAVKDWGFHTGGPAGTGRCNAAVRRRSAQRNGVYADAEQQQ